MTPIQSRCGSRGFNSCLELRRIGRGAPTVSRRGDTFNSKKHETILF